MKTKRHKPRTARMSQNPVTGKLERVELTPRRLAFERIVQAIDRERIKFSNAEAEALVREVVAQCGSMTRHTGGSAA